MRDLSNDQETGFGIIQRLLGMPPDAEQQFALQNYVNHLITWNRTYSLIGPAALDSLWSRQLPNALTLLPLLPDAARIADMGSGAGLPAIILAIFSTPTRQFHLYEANQKKVRFLNFIVTELQLGNRVMIHKKRIEEPHADSRTYDVTLCRALADLESIAKLSRFLLKPDGICLALKGRLAQDEVQRFQHSKQAQYFMAPTIHPAPDNPESVIVALRMVSRETGKQP
ncbi:MAG: 16S rRNA (guanine(527)-N(7))-methyltransferase RsmG [Magnetococcales bacterium]|nr:16S rRNA (guanine(527)-N(7))-methyltransferase RsmG [Magnetococcales bacterium]